MVECPACGKMNRGTRCSCGHFSSKNSGDQKYPAGDEKANQRAASETAHQAKVDKWLLDRRIVSSEMSKPERMKAMAKYRNSIGKEPKRYGRQWADDILSREGDGESLPVIACEWARKVVNQHSYSSDDPTEEIDLDGIPTDF